MSTRALPSIRPLYRKLQHLQFVLISLLLSSTAWADASLLERYHKLKNGLSSTLPGTHISLTSSEQSKELSAEVSSILHHPFEMVAGALAEVESWCQFMPLHFNIKACTNETRNGEDFLTLYSGRKSYQSPEDSYKMDYRYKIIQHDEKQLSLRLNAEQGPANTHDYRIEIDALRVEEGTVLRIYSAYQPSLLSSILTRGYLTTLGRDKVGFSRIEQDGESHLVQGIRGIIERNVMRYHLAIDTFLSTQALPETTRHKAALASWFRQNDGYHQQLHEMEQADYLKIKHREWNNQQRLQQALNERIHLAAIPRIKKR
ncbi:MAG: hypothetical protein ABFS08_03335 [Pseudomonadota bacterium]